MWFLPCWQSSFSLPRPVMLLMGAMAGYVKEMPCVTAVFVFLLLCVRACMLACVYNTACFSHINVMYGVSLTYLVRVICCTAGICCS